MRGVEYPSAVAALIPNLIGGSVIIESIFSIPGMGELSFKGLVARDYPMIMAVFTVSAVLTLVGMLVADLLYSIAEAKLEPEIHAHATRGNVQSSISMLEASRASSEKSDEQ